jgi:nucleoside-diphosphate-sugar epimerase
VRHSLADVTRLRALLAWVPDTPFADGLRRTWLWYQENHRAAPAADR